MGRRCGGWHKSQPRGGERPLHNRGGSEIAVCSVGQSKTE
jgi:hypothetical protein